ncbi:hypothetical protein [Mycolicibacterium gilvum]|uniref:Secreted protein n=2 Tax=Mycolicibacterium gilvum TaxID=1804 RepID=E6TMG5_MYCSR|nr:hypothetical protein Mspyr1_39310 [Mycolicibacterium gilvum Spyr1]MCV7055116.1 hypothetical protein [Mycolicibacterium gilvum]STZ42432.1 putative secreted protein [Mycolicibacterium gilvum]
MVLAASLAAGLWTSAPGAAQPPDCDDAFCTPGITPAVVLGAPCGDTANYVFGTTSWGRLVFCGSPRRYEPRYFRSPSMAGVKALDANCAGYENWVAQSPEGLFLSCQSKNGAPTWSRGDDG